MNKVLEVTPTFILIFSDLLRLGFLKIMFQRGSTRAIIEREGRGCDLSGNTTHLAVKSALKKLVEIFIHPIFAMF